MHNKRASPSRKTRDTSSKVLKRLQKYPVCNHDGALISANSYLNENVNLDIYCKIQTSNCRYKIKCKFENKAWNCKLGEHIYTSVVCCDFVTNPFK